MNTNRDEQSVSKKHVARHFAQEPSEYSTASSESTDGLATGYSNLANGEFKRVTLKRKLIIASPTVISSMTLAVFAFVSLSLFSLNGFLTPEIDNAFSQTISMDANSALFQATNPFVTCTVLTERGWQKEQAQDGVFGSSEDRQIPIQAIKLNISSKVDGELNYCVSDRFGVWEGWKKCGIQAGGRGVSALRIVPTGKLADDYNVWYSARAAGMDWGGWACNGKPAGVSGSGIPLVALRITITNKSDEAPGSTESPLQEVLGSISGDKELDTIIENIVASNIGEDESALWNAYEYVASYDYIRQNELPEGDWTTWSVEYAKEMYKDGMGNCYRFASLLCWLARCLGYDARVISGRVPTSEGISPHGWVEIRQNNMAYVCDSDMHKFKEHLNLFMVPYDETPFIYYHLDETPYTNANALGEV